MGSGTCRILLGKLKWENVNTILLKLWRVLQVLNCDTPLHATCKFQGHFIEAVTVLQVA
jgi:hypothetical protein